MNHTFQKPAYETPCKLYQMFQQAATSIKYPTITLRAPKSNLSMCPDSASTYPVKLHLAGMNSRYRGNIVITNGLSYNDPDNTFYGWITPKGEIHVTGWAATQRTVETNAVASFLGRYLQDPVACSKIQGQKYGSCCFCGKELTAAESLAVGYGPVCAETYGLPWGEKIEDAATSLLNSL